MTTLPGVLLLALALTAFGSLAERFAPRDHAHLRRLLCRLTLALVALCLPAFLIASQTLPAKHADPTFPETPEAGVRRVDSVAANVAASAEKPATLPARQPTDPRPRLAVAIKPSMPARRPGFAFSDTISRDASPRRSLLFMIYVAGAVVGLSRILLAWRVTVRLRENGAPISAGAPFSIPARLSSEIRGASLVGLRAPILLLGPDFFDTEPIMQAAILRHEDAHQRGGDPRWNAAFLLAGAILWPASLLPLLRRRHEEACEEIADRAAVDGEISPRRYAQNLLILATSSPELCVGIGAARSHLGQRIERLLATSRSPGLTRRARNVCAGVSLAVAGFATIAGARSFANGQPPTLGSDTRLARVATVSAEGVALSELLPRIQAATGIALVADPRLADQKVVVFAKNRPLSETLANLATLLGGSWRQATTSDGARLWRLETTLRTRQLEARLENDDRAWILNRLDKLAAEARDPVAIAEREKLPDDARQAFADRRLAFDVLARLTGEQRNALADTGHVKFPVAALSAAQKQQIAPYFYKGDQFKDNPEFKTNADGSFTLDGVTPIRPEKMERTYLSFDLSISRADENRGTFSVRMTAPTGLGIPLAEFDAPEAFALPLHGNPYDGSAIETETVPEPLPSGPTWIDRLKALSEKSGAPIFADFYRSAPRNIGNVAEIREKSGPVYALDLLCTPEGSLWWNRGRTLFLRKRDWYRQRRYEVSDAWRDAAVAELKAKNGKFSARNLSVLSTLTFEQLIGLQGDAKRNESSVQAMPEALRLIRIAPPPVASERPPWELVPIDVASPKLRPGLDAFAERYLHPTVLLGIDPQNFGFLVLVQPVKDAPKPSVDFTIYLQPTKGGFGIGCSLIFPLDAPNDRRDRTVVRGS